MRAILVANRCNPDTGKNMCPVRLKEIIRNQAISKSIHVMCVEDLQQALEWRTQRGGTKSEGY